MATNETAQAKVRLRIGDLSFEGEGTQDWLSSQISSFLETAITTEFTAKPDARNSSADNTSPDTPPNESLASFLRAAGGASNQVQRFLATAAWLSRRGHKPLTAGLVAKTLQEHEQKRLGNPADCLNKNVAKGYCEKTSSGFIVTDEGWHGLGIKA